MKASFTKEEIDAMVVRRKEAADFEASAPERNVWEKSVYAALMRDLDDAGAITVADLILMEWRKRFRKPAEVRQ